MKKIILILLLSFLFLSGCSPKLKVYNFHCNEQEPDIVYNFFPLAINSVDYRVAKIDKDSNLIIATKPILITNKPKGIERHSMQIKINFVFAPDTMKSKMTQYYVVEMNEKQKIKKLTSEQLEKYEQDVITLQEKLLFYCNPKFKGR